MITVHDEGCPGQHQSVPVETHLYKNTRYFDVKCPYCKAILPVSSIYHKTEDATSEMDIYQTKVAGILLAKVPEHTKRV